LQPAQPRPRPGGARAVDEDEDYYALFSERRADAGEIEDTIRRIETLLERGALSPVLVTIARSVDDGFTPRDAWPGIEWRLLRALAAAYPRATVRLDVDLGMAPPPPEGLPAMPAATPRGSPPAP